MIFQQMYVYYTALAYSGCGY